MIFFKCCPDRKTHISQIYDIGQGRQGQYRLDRTRGLKTTPCLYQHRPVLRAKK
nr:MAG TPA: hypothetical protein [Caudoviricetes sp.]